MKLFLLSALALLAGCVSANNLTYQMETWKGSDGMAVQRDWGVPTSEQKLADGSRSLTYSTESCDIVFGIDASGRVASATWRGNKYKCKKQIHMAPSAN